MPKHPPQKQSHPLKHSRRRFTLLVAILLIAGLGYGGWSLRQLTRPGRVHFDRGMDDAAVGKFREAEREWQSGVREDPTFPGCYERLGDLYQNVKNYPGAVTNYAAAARLSPHTGRLFQKLALVQEAEGDYKDALVSARKASELFPLNAAVAGLYGDLAKKRSDNPDAIKALRLAHRLDPKNGKYVVDLAGVEMDNDDMDDAQRDLTGYLAGHPNDPFACYLIAVIYNQKPRTTSNLNMALMYAERSYSTGNAPSNIYPLLGQLYLSADRVQDALNTCLIDLHNNPNDTDVMATLIACYNRLGQTKKAGEVSSKFQALTLRHNLIDHLRHALGFNPNNISDGLELAKLLAEDGQTDEARNDYLFLLHQAPHDPRIRPAFAAFYKSVDQPALAKQILVPSSTP
jgi:tetratricopeptide (TPR) repeat protein